MKTKAAFTSLLGLTLLTTILASSTAEAQMRTSVAPRKTSAKSQLKTKIKTAAPAKEENSRFSLNISETYFGKPDNNKNSIESYFSAGFVIAENFSLGLETGLESHIEDHESNSVYDLEGSLTVSGIEIAKDLTFTTGLIGIYGSSRGSRDKGFIGAYGIKGNFGLKVGTLSFGLDNSFVQAAYKSAPIATPEENVALEPNEKRFYGNEYSKATTVLSAAVPVGPVKFKNDVRFRQSTPYEGEETRSLRYRTRVSYGIVENLSVTGGAAWTQKVTDPKRAPFFDQKNRLLFLNLSLDV